MRKLAIAMVCGVALLVCSCQQTPSEVVDEVLMDFGVRERPEGYVSGADRVFERLGEVGKLELKRLNQEGRRGEIKYQEMDEFRGKYYKEVKTYEDYHPLEARATSGGSMSERGYVAYIEYAYRIYQSPRKGTRAEASAASANISTAETGREVFRYRFNSGGAWNGARGERVKR